MDHLRSEWEVRNLFTIYSFLHFFVSINGKQPESSHG